MVCAGLQCAAHPTEALLKLDEESEQAADIALDEFNEMLVKVGQLLEQMQNGQYTAVASATTEQSQEVLSDAFVASVKNTAKPGLKIR